MDLAKYKFRGNSTFPDIVLKNAINKYNEQAVEEIIQNCDIRHLKQLVKSDERLSAVKIALDLNVSLPKPIMTRTVRHYLRDLGFEYVIKQWLSSKH